MINKATTLSLIQQIRSKDKILADCLESLLDGLVENDLDNQALLERIDDETLHLKYSFGAWNDADQVLTTGTETVVDFNTDLWNYGHMHHEVTNLSRGIALVNGRYVINAGIVFAADAVGVRRVRLRKTKLDATTVDIARMTVTNSGAGAVTSLVISAEEDMLRGEYIQVLAFQNSGGNLNITSIADYSPRFTMQGISVLENQ